ncbi:hypothetical protein [Methylobacterium flocculans]|uniref:hypothetical protein n=1 Tax=Methylobacterium flocculans TaxID=2984843 RepID=UPI0021F32A84|nr:hypothetical protein [Methylobacterium sp. FF17]
MARERRSVRNEAFNDVLEYLTYRIAVCRAGVRRYEASHGPTSRAAATERSALFEAELIKNEIGQLGVIQRRSKRFKALVAERAAYRPSQPPSPQEESRG